MIYLTVMGRCGNQMFQYAFARMIAQIQNDELTINFGDLHSYTEKDDPSFCDELCNFKVSSEYQKICTSDDLVMHYGSRRQKLIYSIYRKCRKLYGKLGINPKKANSQFRNVLSSCGIFIDTSHREKSFVLKRKKEKNIFIRGYFEDPQYFKSIENELKTKLVPIYPVSEKNQKFYKTIVEENSICVSFRKWEVGGREICGEEYYKKAFAYILSKVHNPRFVIFSNDVEWVKTHFDLPADCLFEENNNPIWEKVLLMSSCKHFVITNSTFAWWIQYLGMDPNKIVVSPGKWFENEQNRDLLIMDKFIAL